LAHDEERACGSSVRKSLNLRRTIPRDQQPICQVRPHSPEVHPHKCPLSPDGREEADAGRNEPPASPISPPSAQRCETQPHHARHEQAYCSSPNLRYKRLTFIAVILLALALPAARCAIPKSTPAWCRSKLDTAPNPTAQHAPTSHVILAEPQLHALLDDLPSEPPESIPAGALNILRDAVDSIEWARVKKRAVAGPVALHTCKPPLDLPSIANATGRQHHQLTSIGSQNGMAGLSLLLRGYVPSVVHLHAPCLHC